ncbi:hypothetical protein [Halomonas sp. CSM-2]|uniref:hypothetical protein n=1 Tax=Halomonas sp. CSM-2 TaxID=1975722 RepID=UPI000A283D98|nr:hypothetical protein [Halomonas sp. CSM-2]
MSKEQKWTQFEYPKNMITTMISLEDAIKSQYLNGIECTPENLANPEIRDFTYHLKHILYNFLEGIEGHNETRIESTFFIETEGEHENKYIGILFLEDKPNHEALTKKLATIAYEIAHRVVAQTDISNSSYTQHTLPEEEMFIQEQSEKFINKNKGRNIKHGFSVSPKIKNAQNQEINICVNGKYCEPKSENPDSNPIEGYALPAGYDEYDNTILLYSIDSDNKISSKPFTLTSKHPDHFMTIAKAKIEGGILYYTGECLEETKCGKKQKTYSILTLSIYDESDPLDNYSLQPT